jgi:hypothetical protein
LYIDHVRGFQSEVPDSEPKFGWRCSEAAEAEAFRRWNDHDERVTKAKIFWVEATKAVLGTDMVLKEKHSNAVIYNAKVSRKML